MANEDEKLTDIINEDEEFDDDFVDEDLTEENNTLMEELEILREENALLRDEIEDLEEEIDDDRLKREQRVKDLFIFGFLGWLWFYD